MLTTTLEKVIGTALTVTADLRELKGHIRAMKSSPPPKPKVTLPQTDQVFAMNTDRGTFACEECKSIKFEFISKVKVKCADCGTTYLVEFSAIEWVVIYYKG